jgi:hypothetical protein
MTADIDDVAITLRQGIVAAAQQGKCPGYLWANSPEQYSVSLAPGEIARDGAGWWVVGVAGRELSLRLPSDVISALRLLPARQPQRGEP